MYFKFALISFICLYFFTGCSFKQSEETINISQYKNYDYDTSFESASLQNTIKQNTIKKSMVKQNILQSNDKTIIAGINTLYKEDIESTNTNQELYDFYEEWKGVRYKYGGNSKKGIDCSALMQEAYKKNFNVNLPRTTTSQAKIGKEIDKSELATGDLIFFKTGRNSRHVGVYIEDGKFIHASTKRGVTISTLDNSYFSKHYWKSQRIID